MENENPLNYDFPAVSAIFLHIYQRVQEAGLYPLWDKKSSQTIQIFADPRYSIGKIKPIGAIQYEGSNNFKLKPPRKVNFRFFRRSISSVLKTELENIGAFRQDTNKKPIDPSSESIAFKFSLIDEDVDNTIAKIILVLKQNKH